MTDQVQSFFEAVRRACKPAVWSRGIELNRARAVSDERADADEVVIRVARPGGLISLAVTFFLDDGDWECECAGGERGCEHVAAAVIAWRRAGQAGAQLHGVGRDVGRVAYRFRRLSGALALERTIVLEGDEHHLATTLSAVASGRVDGPSFVAAQADLAAELALGTHRKGPLPSHLVRTLFARLARCSDIRLDDRATHVSGDPVLPRCVLTDQGDGFRLVLEPDPEQTEAFSNGAVLCGDTLRPLGDSRLSGRERHELPRGIHFGPDRLMELLTEVLPSLEGRIHVEIRTRRLPETRAEPPRIRIETERAGQTLSVLALLVYGDPPRARVDGGRLVHLGGTVPLRDEKAERRLVRRLQHELDLAPGIRDNLVGEAAVRFTSKLPQWEGEIAGTAHRHFRLVPPLMPCVTPERSDFVVRFESVAESGRRRSHGEADASTVLRAWREGASLVPLMEGGWAPLPVDWLQRFGHRVADLLAARGADGSLPRSMLPDLAALCEELDRPAPPELTGLRFLVDGFERIPEAEPPADLNARLREYQRRGVDWLVFLRDAGLGALLADDMGLGKTLQALCALRGRTLVVAPTSVLHNWFDEIERFRPALTVSRFHGPGRTLAPTADVTLTTYALLRLDAGLLAGQQWDTVILDEAQAIKNPDSQVAAAAFRLRAGFKLALTGTPVENRLEELWSQFHFIERGLLGGRADFHERYAAPIAAGDGEAAARLRERIRPFVLRRLKREVARELPPRTEMVLRCELSAEEREVYDSIRVATLDEVVRNLKGGGNVMAALEALLRLRQAACHAGLVPGQQSEASSKLSLLLESVENIVAEGHKALVFSQWTSLLDLAEPKLRAAGLAFVRLDGSTRDRRKVVRTFQDRSGPPLMLISLKAGGTGLNLTAADHVFLLDPWWNPAVEDQAADRAHRLGQDKPVMIYRLVAEETVEERILLLQQRKREMADVVLGQADRATGITREELLELLR